MRVLVLLLAVSCWLSAISAQWLETEIKLPDSLLGLRAPQVVLFDQDRDCVYVGGEQGVVVLDAGTLRSRALVSTDGSVTGLCLNPVRGKLYAAVDAPGAVVAIDCSTLQVLRSIPVSGLHPSRMAYSRAADRVFVTAYGADRIVAIACAADTIADVFAGFEDVNDICVNPAGTKLYCADEYLEGVWVLDCSTGAHLDSVWTGDGPFTLLYNYLNDKVYCSNYGDEDVAVIDAVRDSLLWFVAMDGRTANLALNPLLNRVYCACNNYEIGVICGTGDTLLGVAYCDGVPSIMAFDSAANVLCAAVDNADRIVLIDGTSHAVLAILPAGDAPKAICYDPHADRVLIVNYLDATLTTLDCSARSVADTLLLAMLPGPLVWSGDQNRVYCADQRFPAVAVIDGERNQARKLISLEHRGALLLPVPAENRVYCFGPGTEGSSALSIIIQPEDSVSRVVRYGGAIQAAVYTSDRQLYWLSDSPSSHQLLRFDCQGESLVGRLLLPYYSKMAYAVQQNRLFISCGGNVLAVDAATGQIIRTIPVPGGPDDVFYVPLHDVVVVTVPDSNALTFIDAKYYNLLGTLPVGHFPIGMCYNLRHDLLYCAVAGPQLVLVDMAWRVTVGALPITPREPTMVLDTIADRLYLQSRNKLEVVDCSGNHRIVGRFTTGNTNDIAWNPVNRRVYVPIEGRSTLAVFRDSVVTGLCEAAPDPAQRAGLPSIVRGLLTLPVSGVMRRASCVLLDITGRKVLDLRSGPNDVSRLAPGVYFVRSRPSAVAKVVIQR